MAKSNSKNSDKSSIVLPFKLREAIKIFGEDVVFLPCYFGTKKASIDGWQKLTSDVMRDPKHLEKLAKAGNFGVVTGIASGGVISIDIDKDEEVESFLKQNPHLGATFRTKGKRGCNIWIRILGYYPPFSKLKMNGEHWGEFRSHHHQTVIWGRHPEGVYYKWLVKAPLVVAPYESIVWPQGIERVTSSTDVKGGTKIVLIKPCQDGKEGKDGKDGKDVVSGCVCSGSSAPQVFSLESILTASMPSHIHDTHPKIFLLARGVITLEYQAGRKFVFKELEEIFNKWHSAVPPEFLTQDKEDYFDEFLDAYQDAKHPLGGASLQTAFEKAKAEPFPEEAMLFSNPQKRLLVATLFHLQAAAGDEPIFLPVLKAEKLLGIPARTCTYWLSGLVVRGILTIVSKADKVGRRATRYRFISKGVGGPKTA